MPGTFASSVRAASGLEWLDTNFGVLARLLLRRRCGKHASYSDNMFTPPRFNSAAHCHAAPCHFNLKARDLKLVLQ